MPFLSPLAPPRTETAQAALVQVEFNELCPTLLQQFMAEGWLPNFQRFHDSAAVYTTDAAEEPPHLEPWVQWPTVHTGLPYSQHGASKLGDGPAIAAPGVAELLSDAGVPVGVFGSMNLNYARAAGRWTGFLVPDPWDAKAVATPAWVAPYSRAVAGQVRESSRPDGGGGLKALAGLAWFLVRHGLTLGTAWAAAKQLLTDRRDAGLKWRRACVLDRLNYDVFRHLTRALGVRFGTFFCNSTAHFQHYYWRNMEPAAFATPPAATDHPSLAGAVRYGYAMMDRLVGRLLADYPDRALVLCTALSQQPWRDTTKCTYRPRDFAALLRFAGIAADTPVRPVMAEQFHLDLPTAAAAAEAEGRLKALRVGDDVLMGVRREGASLFAGCRMFEVTPADRVVRGPHGDAAFGDLFAAVHSMRSGRHHPDGVLWVRPPGGGRGRVVPGRVPLTAVAPTVLRYFGAPVPAAMAGEPLAV